MLQQCCRVTGWPGNLRAFHTNGIPRPENYPSAKQSPEKKHLPPAPLLLIINLQIKQDDRYL